MGDYRAIRQELDLLNPNLVLKPQVCMVHRLLLFCEGKASKHD